MSNMQKPQSHAANIASRFGISALALLVFAGFIALYAYNPQGLYAALLHAQAIPPPRNRSQTSPRCSAPCIVPTPAPTVPAQRVHARRRL